MIRIAHIISDLHTGGAQSMLTKVVTALEGDEFENHVISLTGEGSSGHNLAAEGIHVYYLGMQRGIPNPLGIIRLLRILAGIRPHIVQGWLYHGDLMALLGAKLHRAPILLWNVRQSQMDMHAYSALSRMVLKLLVRLSPVPDAVLVNSRRGQEAHTQLGYRPKRWIFIPNGFDTERFRPDSHTRQTIREALDIAEKTLLIGHIARFDSMKDQRTFIDAAVRLLAQAEETHFLMAGPGITADNTELLAMIPATYRSRFYLLGDRGDIPAILNALDIYTSSSAFGEGFSNAIGEAMATGLPCVVTDVGDSGYIVGESGIVVPPRDPVSMMQAWGILLKNPDERLRRSQLARQRISSEFSVEQIASQYRDAYSSFSD